MTRRAASPGKKSNTQRTSRQVYPFTAIVGQDEMKLALLLNVIDPVIGGVLIMGHRGTGKSTAVRAIADLLPQVWRVTNCHFGCDPDDAENLCVSCSERLAAEGTLARKRSSVNVVNLPLGATEDRVCGTIDIQRALKDGIKAFEPGLLARANRGFLYVDEVNLLEDHLVDLLLDVAVTGRNSVEREGISLDHPARFVLVGSGNPEEGELRPQLVDRFGLCAQILTLEDLEQRVEIVKLREAFERDSEALVLSFEKEQQSMRRRLARARKLVGSVKISKELLREVAGLCLQLRIDGHRGELTIARAARALAAFEGRKNVTREDVRKITPLALRHRLRRDPLEPSNGGGSRIERALEKAFGEPGADLTSEEREASAGPDGGSKTKKSTSAFGQNHDEQNIHADNGTSRLVPEAEDARLPEQGLAHDSSSHRYHKQSTRTQRGGGGVSYNARHGRYSRAVMHAASQSKVAIDATLRTTAARACIESLSRPGPNALRLTPCASDLRFKSFKKKEGTLFIMAIDTSGSMALNRIQHAKGALVSLLNKSYIRRDRVALITFRGKQAEELLPPSQSMSRARRILDELQMGGPTPLASALLCAINMSRRARRQGTGQIALLVFTDGRANIGLRSGESGSRSFNQAEIDYELAQLGAALKLAGVSITVVDTQSRFTSSGEGRELASRLDALYVNL